MAVIMVDPSVVQVHVLCDRVAKLIQRTVDVIRTVPEFSVTQNLLKRDTSIDLGNVALHTVLVSKDSGLVDLIQDLQRSISAVLPKTHGLINIPNDGNQRALLVQDILLPLLYMLYECYNAMDDLEAATADQTLTKTGKPAPPPGMLSIQQYTDIGVFVELTVCTSILPLLDANVLLPIKDRVRYMLSKAMAGRIPQRALMWGSECKLSTTRDNRVIELCTTVSVLTKLLMLDRFRPMLLPRHLPDLFAALWQADEVYRQLSDDANSNVQASIAAARDAQRLLSDNIDTRWQAKSFQTLLASGVNAPQSLKVEMSRRLVLLAHTDLSAVVHVFVTNVAQSDVSAAASRLARALKSSQSNDNRLLDQIIAFLDDTGDAIWQSKEELPDRIDLTAEMNANLLTIRALLDGYPNIVLTGHVAQRMFNGLRSDDNSVIVAAIKRVASLLLVTPPTSVKNTISLLAFAPLDTSTNDYVFSLLLRIASTHTILHSQVKELTIWALQKLAQVVHNEAMIMKKYHVDANLTVAAAILTAIAPSHSDIDGFSYTYVNYDGKECWKFEKGERLNDNLEAVTQHITARTTVVVKCILATNSTDMKGENGSLYNSSALSLSLLKLLLDAYFTTANGCMCNLIPPDILHLTSIVSIPILCENLAMDQLLGTTVETNGLFEVMALVFGKHVQRIQSMRVEIVTQSDGTSSSKSLQASVRYTESLRRINRTKEVREEEHVGINTMNSDLSDTLLYDVTSVLLSLLIAILELGNKDRTALEENELIKLAYLLEHISLSHNEVDSNSQIKAELADTASYAVALIAARKIKPKGNISVIELSDESSTDKVLQQANEDLSSKEPPLRARGIVSLRRLIYVIDDDTVNTSDGNDDVVRVRGEILRLAIIGLTDHESYVYLAAIHTVVALIVTGSLDFFWKVGVAVVTGHIKCDGTSDIDLSVEQRIKLVEAIVLGIQRKKATRLTRDLLDLFLLGATNKHSDNKNESNSLIVEVSSHNYFHGTQTDATDEENTDDEQLLRFNTGGPLFASEENDILRGASLSIIAELVASATPKICSRYCTSIVECVIQILKSSGSRVLTRGAALLAKALYFKLEQELDELKVVIASNDGAVQCDLAMALVQAKDEVLREQLIHRQQSDNNMKLIGLNDDRFDPATSARCEEALQARDRVAQEGLLRLAQYLIVHNADSPSHHLVTNMLTNKEHDKPVLKSALIQEL